MVPRKREAVCWLLVVLATAGAARAADPVFTGSVDRTEVAVDEHLILTLSISASNPDRAEDIRLPDTGTLILLETRSEESTSSVMFSGGRSSYRRTKKVILTLKPTREGEVVIGPASMRYQGKLYKTDPITVRVVRKDSRSPFDHMMLQRRTEIGADDIFVRAYAQPDVVVEGQQLTVTLVVFTRVEARIAGIHWPRLDGFFSLDREVSQDKTDHRVVNGVLYLATVLERKALFPLQPGEFTLGTIEVEARMSTGPYRPVQVRSLRTKPFSVTVRPLPEEGRPRDFNRANVGRYQLLAGVEASQVALNQPLTYTLVVRGSGNIQRIRPPELPELASFKLFDPTVEVNVSKHGPEVKGSKAFEYILVPLASGKHSIPAMEFSYFDPQDGRYVTLRTEPQSIQVVASPTSAGGELAGQGQEVNILVGGFKPIRYDSTLAGHGPPFYRHVLFLPMLIVPPSLYLLVVAFGLFHSRIRTDSRRARMRRAWLRGRRRLRRAGQLVSTGRASECFAELKEAIMDGIEARTGFNPQGLTQGELRIRLEGVGFSPNLLEAINAEIENCDFGRFAPTTSRGEEMQASCQRVRNLFRRLERERIRLLERR